MSATRVLLMEDDPITSKIIQRKLENHGFLCDTRADGESGLNALTEGVYDVILLDYKMPVLDGLGVLRALSERGNKIPAVMLSAVNEIDTALKAIKLGASDYLVKTQDEIDPYRLKAAIEHALERATLRQALEESNQRLRESEEKFRAFTENTTDITLLLDKNYSFCYASPSIRNICGYDPKEIEGKHPKDFIHLEDLPALKQVMSRAWAQPGKTCPTTDFRAQFKDGNWYHFNGKVTALPDTLGIEGIIINCRDISKRKQAETALLYEKLRFEKYLATAGTIILAMEPNGSIILINPQGLKLLKATEDEVIDQFWIDRFVPESERANLRALFHDLLSRKTRQAENYEGTVLTQGGEQRIVSWSFNPVEENDRIIELLLTGIDITERKRAEAALAKSEERYELATKAAKVGVWDWDLISDVMYMDPYLKEALGYRDDELDNHPDMWRKHLHPEDLIAVLKPLEACIQGKQDFFEVEHRMVCRDGSSHWFITRARTARDSNGKPIRLTGTDTEITALKLVELQIEHMASHDPLTSLPNRILLNDRLKISLAKARRERKQVGVLFLDLDGFKPVNDQFGHDAGDTVLRIVAERLNAVVRGSDTVARFGGDEFILVLGEVGHPRDAERVCLKVLNALNKPYEALPGKFAHVSGSIGISIYPADGDTPEALLKAADTAMYQAKGDGKNGYRFYSDLSQSELAPLKGS